MSKSTHSAPWHVRWHPVKGNVSTGRCEVQGKLYSMQQLWSLNWKVITKASTVYHTFDLFSTIYPSLLWRSSRITTVAQMSFSPATSISSSWEILRLSKARWDMPSFQQNLEQRSGFLSTFCSLATLTLSAQLRIAHTLTICMCNKQSVHILCTRLWHWIPAWLCTLKTTGQFAIDFTANSIVLWSNATEMGRISTAKVTNTWTEIRITTWTMHCTDLNFEQRRLTNSVGAFHVLITCSNGTN